MALHGDRSRNRSQVNQVAVKANNAFVWFTGAAWQFYRAVLSGPAELVIPEHTRDAFFQLWFDLRSNVPKDRNWVRQHATALQPKTSVGYIALASFAAFVTAGGTSLLCLTLATIAGLAYALVGVAVVAGLTAGFWLLVLSGILLFSSLVIAWSATCMAAGYIFLASANAVLTYLQGLVQQRQTPLQESRKAEETVQSSSIPTASKADAYQSVSNSSLARGPQGNDQYQNNRVSNASVTPGLQDSDHFQNNTHSTESIYSPSRNEQYPGDISPGRAQQLLGIGDVNKTDEGMNTADVAAMGGPSLAGKPAEAIHPSLLSDSQRHHNGPFVGGP